MNRWRTHLSDFEMSNTQRELTYPLSSNLIMRDKITNYYERYIAFLKDHNLA